MSSLQKVVIVASSRTPIGKFLGALSPLSAVELGKITLEETLKRSGLNPREVEEIILGQVIQAGCGQNPARQAAMVAGLPSSAGALTINKVCGSGLKAVMLAAQSIRTGDQHCILAGGMESMSNAPYLLPGARAGYRAGHQQVLDANTQDGLWCSISGLGMVDTAEKVQHKYSISRADQDAYTLLSHQKAVEARSSGAFSAEIAPVRIKSKKGDTLVEHDESPRADTSLEVLGKLRAISEGGSVTPGNAPGLNDGAASLLLMSEERALALGLSPVAEILGYAQAGLEPEWVMMSPVPATRKLLEKLGWSASDVDLWELNEAFSVQSLAVMSELDLEPSRVNVHGGAVALGHPIGASGARILVTLLGALERQNREMGVATLCMGGANGLALAVRRLS